MLGTTVPADQAIPQGQELIPKGVNDPGNRESSVSEPLHQSRMLPIFHHGQKHPPIQLRHVLDSPPSIAHHTGTQGPGFTISPQVLLHLRPDLQIHSETLLFSSWSDTPGGEDPVGENESRGFRRVSFCLRRSTLVL